jgi:hypothetical protein
MPTADHGFHDGAINLYKTHDNYVTKYKPSKTRPLFREHFALGVVNLAHGVFCGNFGVADGELAGIRTCLIHLTLRLRQRNYLWRIPLGYEELFAPWPHNGRAGYHDVATLIVDSLILTVTKYRDELREYHTNLAPLVFADVLVGFELACDWAQRMVPLDPAKNDLITLVDVSAMSNDPHWSRWVYGPRPRLVEEATDRQRPNRQQSEEQLTKAREEVKRARARA